MFQNLVERRHTEMCIRDSNHKMEKGLSSKERQEGIYFVQNLDEIKQFLKMA